MTARLYLSDPYCQEFEAAVTEINGEWLILDRSAFYPGGGGQVADTGTISDLPVTEVKKENNLVMHRVPGHGRNVGDAVTGKIDWVRRYEMMKGHTGEHLLFSQLSKLCPDLHLVKISITPEKKALMVNGPLDWNMVSQAQRKAQEAIESSLEIKEKIVGRDDPLISESRVKLERIHEDGVRIIEIGDVDRAACAGVHVHNTRELGMILVPSLKSAHPVADLEVEFEVGDKAIRKAMDLSVAALRASDALGSRPQDLLSALENLLQENERRKATIKHYETKVLADLVPSYIRGIKLYSGLFENMDKKALIDTANRMIKEPSVCALGSVGDNFMLVIACHPDIRVDCASILRRTLEVVGGKGGGKSTFATGGVQGRDHAERCMSSSLAEITKTIEKKWQE
ncbi:MAG: hypothetical protein GXX95_04840 [Methanomassiliicoccus sp.]|nr:hypothetical protein [Methanomassiliicoccus sp.]